MWAGYHRGWRETLAMRVADVILSFPSLLLAVVVLYVFSPSAANIVLVLAITRIPIYLRTARAEAAELRSRLFVDAARTFGTRAGSIIRRHVCPIVLPTLLTVATLDFCFVMLTESLAVLPRHRHPAARRQLGPDGRPGPHLPADRLVAVVLPRPGDRHHHRVDDVLAAWVRIATDPDQRWRLTVPSKTRRQLPRRRTTGPRHDRPQDDRTRSTATNPATSAPGSPSTSTG